jgi:hypothetical protein
VQGEYSDEKQHRLDHRGGSLSEAVAAATVRSISELLTRDEHMQFTRSNSSEFNPA